MNNENELFNRTEEQLQQDDQDMQKEWEQVCESMREYNKEQQQLKNEYKQKLKHLINTKNVWRWLDDHDEWKPEGIYSIKIEYKHNGYYNKMMPHAKILGDDTFKYLDMHRQTEHKSEVGTGHIFLQQWTHYEDSYSGYIAFPLKDFRYFLVSYNC